MRTKERAYNNWYGRPIVDRRSCLICMFNFMRFIPREPYPWIVSVIPRYFGSRSAASYKDVEDGPFVWQVDYVVEVWTAAGGLRYHSSEEGKPMIFAFGDIRSTPETEFSPKSYREVIFHECGRRTDGCAYKVETSLYYRGRMLRWHCNFRLSYTPHAKCNIRPIETSHI